MTNRIFDEEGNEIKIPDRLFNEVGNEITVSLSSERPEFLEIKDVVENGWKQNEQDILEKVLKIFGDKKEEIYKLFCHQETEKVLLPDGVGMDFHSVVFANRHYLDEVLEKVKKIIVRYVTRKR